MARVKNPTVPKQTKGNEAIDIQRSAGKLINFTHLNAIIYITSYTPHLDVINAHSIN